MCKSNFLRSFYNLTIIKGNDNDYYNKYDKSLYIYKYKKKIKKYINNNYLKSLIIF
jgi:hypothetical protein